MPSTPTLKPAQHPGCRGEQEHATRLHTILSRHLGCREMQEELLACIRQAAALPLAITVADSPQEGLTQLRVTAPVDSGGGGRPRVLYDVTAGLAKLGAPCGLTGSAAQVAMVPTQEPSRCAKHKWRTSAGLVTQ